MKKIALVTGSSRGIGAAAAEELAKKGYAVCINYIERRDLAEALTEKLRAQGFQAMSFRADVSDRTAVDSMIKAIQSNFGDVSLLVNNAGISTVNQFQDISPEEWKRTMDVNLGGCFNCTQAVLPPMLHEHEGCIINVSSIWGSHGASCESAYAASKHAVIGLSRSLAAELAPSNIRVNCVAPGAVDTDMSRMLGQDTVDMLENEVIPMGRLGRPEEIAKAIAFLAESGYITGQVLGVDGGFII
ncbi:MAG: elongation factor P 5-aminopentanone reductase [Candidatus Limivicinus sp.]|jgi:3-oxoacyl-[acyl-carrier protein] reductase